MVNLGLWLKEKKTLFTPLKVNKQENTGTLMQMDRAGGKSFCCVLSNPQRPQAVLWKAALILHSSFLHPFILHSSIHLPSLPPSLLSILPLLATSQNAMHKKANLHEFTEDNLGHFFWILLSSVLMRIFLITWNEKMTGVFASWR